ncbi:5'-nucleotidase C-terminal domain-containing protein [Humidisolicoccus flavus]|uniref:5'-nucleotidase C-terminal domain-containing protein n=1 Tax=Humidisolicoccus flavus TaxID=3111414 RepID=UPI003247B802
MLKNRRRSGATIAAVLGLGLVVSPLTVLTASAAPPAGYDPETQAYVNLVHFNDFHGRIDNGLVNGGPATNFNTVKFAGTIEQLRAAEGEEHTLLLSGGDSIGASLYTSSSAKDEPTIDVLNALEVNASAVGNHEFDRGIADLIERVIPNANFPHLAANVTYNGAQVGQAYEIFTVDGIDIAVIGAVTQETPTLVSPDGIEGVVFSDPVDAVNAVAAQLTASGEADVIVAEFHEGAQVSLPANAPQDVQAAALQNATTTSPAFAKIFNQTSADVDVIFNGHTHNTYSYLAPAPAGSDNNGRPIVQGASYADWISQVSFLVDRQTNAIEFDASRLVQHPRSTTPPADLIATYPRVAAVNEIVNAAEAQAQITGSVPVGEITADITTAFNNGARDDRSKPSAMGTLVANMYKDVTVADGAQIGIVNPGGLRNELLVGEDGVVTIMEAVSVLPFANNLWTLDLTGEQLARVIEQQWQRDANGNVPQRPYQQLGFSDNVQYTFERGEDSVGETGTVTSIFIDGMPIAADEIVRVAVPSFLASGGDNFTTFREATNRKDAAIVDSDGFIDYIGANSPLSPDFSVRQLEISELPTGTVAVGQEIEFTVSGLDINSLGAPDNTVLDLYVGLNNIQSFPVVNGTAEVSFAVPDIGALIFEPQADEMSAARALTPPASPLVGFTLVAPESGTVSPILLNVTSEAPFAPIPLDNDQIIPEGENVISANPTTFSAGEQTTVTLPDEYIGQQVSLWIRSETAIYGTPEWATVEADGTVLLDIPAEIEDGAYRLVAQDSQNALIGWVAVQVVPESEVPGPSEPGETETPGTPGTPDPSDDPGAGGAPGDGGSDGGVVAPAPTDGTDGAAGLPQTGSQIAIGAGVLAALLLIFGGVLIARRRKLATADDTEE